MAQEVITWRHAMMYPRWFRLSPRDGTTDREICTNPRVKPPGGTPPTLIHRRITTFGRKKRSLPGSLLTRATGPPFCPLKFIRISILREGVSIVINVSVLFANNSRICHKRVTEHFLKIFFKFLC